jgi:hypothetical protein
MNAINFIKKMSIFLSFSTPLFATGETVVLAGLGAGGVAVAEASAVGVAEAGAVAGGAAFFANPIVIGGLIGVVAVLAVGGISYGIYRLCRGRDGDQEIYLVDAEGRRTVLTQADFDNILLQLENLRTENANDRIHFEAQRKEHREEMADLRSAFDLKLEKQSKGHQEEMATQAASFDLKLEKQSKGHQEEMADLRSAFDEQKRANEKLSIINEELRAENKFLRSHLNELTDQFSKLLAMKDSQIKALTEEKDFYKAENRDLRSKLLEKDNVITELSENGESFFKTKSENSELRVAELEKQIDKYKLALIAEQTTSREDLEEQKIKYEKQLAEANLAAEKRIRPQLEEEAQEMIRQANQAHVDQTGLLLDLVAPTLFSQARKVSSSSPASKPGSLADSLVSSFSEEDAQLMKDYHFVEDREHKKSNRMSN